ncbi:hypothetical protein PHYBOEH_007151 [Phytophthora boehmeriae]|uniref:Necrosis inducing-like protein NPP1 type n=1 Tax=Phytophthora boehmeriae TaxID=109152 RepID=A0A8T1WA07_9STRA|nr:hypothetical protein PHYBOEH_007151 [Phytophthora boehmeriae]
MNLRALFAIAVAVGLSLVSGGTVDHDKLQPFPQPEPVTLSEKVAVKLKPSLYIFGGCVSFPAVNAQGEINGGLKGNSGTRGCRDSPMGSQVYGRSAWHRDYWAIMYAWYYPKGFFAYFAKRRHDWSCAVLWIDNPAFETPTIKGVSTCDGDSYFRKFAPAAGVTKFVHMLSPIFGGGAPYTHPTDANGEYQDLIMWSQLTDEAREGLNTWDFGKAKVPLNDDNFEKNLEEAFPFQD